MAQQTVLSEEDWMERGDPETAWNTLRAGLNERRQRLLACACCRGVLGLLGDPRAVAVVDAAERYADGDAGPAVVETVHRYPGAAPHGIAAAWAAEAIVSLQSGCLYTSARNLAEVVCRAARADRDAHREMDWRSARRRQVGYLCDLHGRYFYGATFDPAWNRWKAGLVVTMARAIYDEYRFGDLPILADALEEAGCEERDILAHCRSPREHVRGCWVIDALLGKE
jgi:hypothetical protein